jgi:hypothetical protein
MAFAIAGRSTVVTVVLAWRKVSAVPDADVNGLGVATTCGFFGLLTLTSWLQDREGGR